MRFRRFFIAGHLLFLACTSAVHAQLLACEDRFGQRHMLRQQVDQTFRFFVHCAPVLDWAETPRQDKPEGQPEQAPPINRSTALRIDPHHVSVIRVPPAAYVPVERTFSSGGGSLAGLIQRGQVYAAIVQDVAHRHDLDPHYLMAMMRVESAFNPKAVSHAGAMGLMQIIPATARRFGVSDPARQLMDPATSVETAARYIKVLRRMFQDDWHLVTAAYNAGEGAVRRYGNQIPPFGETQRYVRDVERYYDFYRQAWPELAIRRLDFPEELALNVDLSGAGRAR